VTIRCAFTVRRPVAYSKTELRKEGAQTCLPHSHCGANVGRAAWVYACSQLHTSLPDLHGQGRNRKQMKFNLRLADVCSWAFGDALRRVAIRMVVCKRNAEIQSQRQTQGRCCGYGVLCAGMTVPCSRCATQHKLVSKGHVQD
jgi:hypothetical protein